MTRRTQAILFTLITALIGIIWREAPLHLPWFAYKYGGSALWAIALYGLLAVILPRLKPLSLALLAATLATFIECSRLVHLPALDAFRLTLAGKLLLGRIFSFKNIAAYLLAILATALLDHYLLPRPTPPNRPIADPVS
jgi:hypothetical protein